MPQRQVSLTLLRGTVSTVFLDGLINVIMFMVVVVIGQIKFNTSLCTLSGP